MIVSSCDWISWTLFWSHYQIWLAFWISLFEIVINLSLILLNQCSSWKTHDHFVWSGTISCDSNILPNIARSFHFDRQWGIVSHMDVTIYFIDILLDNILRTCRLLLLLLHPTWGISNNVASLRLSLQFSAIWFLVFVLVLIRLCLKIEIFRLCRCSVSPRTNIV